MLVDNGKKIDFAKENLLKWHYAGLVKRQDFSSAVRMRSDGSRSPQTVQIKANGKPTIMGISEEIIQLVSVKRTIYHLCLVQIIAICFPDDPVRSTIYVKHHLVAVGEFTYELAHRG